MEVLAALFGLVLVGLLLVSPILAIIAFARSRGMAQQIADLRHDLEIVEQRVSSLVRRQREGEPPSPVASPTPTPAPVPIVAPPPPPAPAIPVAAPPTTSAPPPPTPTPPPPRVRPEPPAPPSPPEPSFDWEGLLGIRGAAWVGGIAFVIAAVLFAKWAIDQGLITPELRIAVLLGSGIAMLIGAEVNLRRGYATTANAVSGAGIAVLYIGLYAARALYGLISLPTAFALMSLVTVVAGLLAVRYDAFFTAVLGLVGGFATPLLLSTGEDNPIGLFSYVLLLNAGLLTISLKRRWHGLASLGLVGTFVIEVGWFGRFMAPEKMLVGLVAFLLFGLVYLVLPLLARDGEDEEGTAQLAMTSAIGGVVPFVFAMVLAGNRRYAGEWPLLFAFVGLLDAALALVALARGRVGLLLAGAMATALTIPLWASQSLDASDIWGPTIAAIVLAVLVNLPARLAGGLGLDVSRPALELSGVIATAGLGLYALVLIGKGLGHPSGPFLVVTAALIALVLERTGPERVPGIAVVGPMAIAVLAQIWFFSNTGTDTLPGHLAVCALVPTLFSLAAGIRRRDAGSVGEDETGVVAATAVAGMGLIGCLTSSSLGGDPVPLFVSLAVLCVLLIVSAVRSGATPLVGLAMAGAAAYMTLWSEARFQDEDAVVVFMFAAAFYVAFLILPVAVPDRLASAWRGSWVPWLTSALAGPFFFYVLRRCFRGMGGEAIIGLLPVAMAALSIALLAAVRRLFDSAEAKLRLRYLALFAAVALWFVAVAIPLQLDRQWITIGWALEGAAVFWLYGRLPHGGLRVFGAVLFAMVGARLLLNPEVLRYEERGMPIVNWLLYTYGVPAVAALVGAAALRRAEARHESRTPVPAAASFLGLILIFALVNLEILDYFGSGRYVELTFERRYERDLAMSVAWGVYAFALLIIGVWRRVRELRFVSLGFLLLTVAKVFLYDLSNLAGVHRILSFLGLGISLILVSLFYQRFVFRNEETR